MLIDCDTCVARGPACADCVVTVLLDAPPVRRAGHVMGIDLDGDEQAALAVLAGSGLIPPLRLVPSTPDDEPRPDPYSARSARKSVDLQGPGKRPEDEHRAAV
jgi:hypothetical protein